MLGILCEGLFLPSAVAAWVLALLLEVASGALDPFPVDELLLFAVMVAVGAVEFLPYVMSNKMCVHERMDICELKEEWNKRNKG